MSGLQHMRGALAAWDAGQTGMLLDSPADVVSRVLELTAPANGLVARTSRGLRQRLQALAPLPPLWFHVLSSQYPGANEAQRRDSMLAALEAQSVRFRLVSIEMPGFLLDDPDRAQAHPPFLPPERGAVRLAAVLQTRCAALQSLDLTDTEIEVWREIDAALPACAALQRVRLTGATFHRDEHPFAGLAQCAALRELHLEDTRLGYHSAGLAPVLAACRALQRLNLRANFLSYTDFRATPQVLVLQHLTDALRHHPSLEHLDVSDCGLSMPCIALLAGSLPTCPRLAHLDVGSHTLDVVKMTALAAMLPRCLALRHLGLRESRAMGTEGLVALTGAQALRGLASLDLHGCSIEYIIPTHGPGAAVVAELALCPRLSALDLSDNDLGNTFTSSLAGRLPQFPALTQLNLAGTKMSDTGVRALAQAVRRCPGLVRLNITRSSCTPETARQMRDAWRTTHADTAGLWMD